MAIFLSFKRRCFRLWITLWKTGIFRIYYTFLEGNCQFPDGGKHDDCMNATLGLIFKGHIF